MTMFPLGDLDEEIYLEQPEGFKKNDKENIICYSKKRVYRLQ